jgi:hypothetical protein
MRSGPRSPAELAKLDPAALAALALQPRAPLMRQRLSGLGAAPLQFPAGSKGNDTPEIASPVIASPSLPDPNFATDPHSYLQPIAPPASTAPPQIQAASPPVKQPDARSTSNTTSDQPSPVANHEIEPTELDRQVFNSIYEGSPTARMLYNYAQSKGYPLQIMRPGDVSKFIQVPNAKATAVEEGPLKRIYVDSLGNQASGDWAHYTAPYHEIVHILQHNLKKRCRQQNTNRTR